MKFEVWAPLAQESATLHVGDDVVPMERADDGWWCAEHEGGAGTRYAFAIDGGDELADPRARRLPDGPDGRAEVVDLAAYDWQDHHWRGVPLPGSVVYEMHVGTFTSAGTLDAAIERLDHLVALGVDLVEVMPVATFPGRHGWGYDGVGLYAVHEPYGGPEAFCRFVDACHAHGLGVVLDVVYNHLGPSGNRLHELGPYFTDAYGTPWGQALNLDGEDSDEVRRFVIENALMWLKDFHVDGLRLDAVHALFDQRAIPMLEELGSRVGALSARLGRPLSLIAESDRNDPLTVTPREGGGMGLDAQWADDVHHALHVALTGETQGYYADFAEPGVLTKTLESVFLHDGTYSTFRRRTHGRPVDRALIPGSRFVASLQTHDQVGNRATGDRISATLSPGLLACGATLLLTAATTPMLFMGEEWGASTPWQYFTDHTDPEIAEAVRKGRRGEFASHGWDEDDVPDPQSEQTVIDSRLDWDEVTGEPHAAVLAFYTELIALRRRSPDLGDPRLDRVVVQHDEQARTVVVHRGDAVVAVNLGQVSAELPVGAPEGREPDDRERVVVLAWDADATQWDGAMLTLPPESAVVLAPVD
ncbi:MAG: malto-oligosyltrehalose trehalohydrolase [Nocardioidaceae bacterium]|nr:malto-oligosyltrehalose trehalohydrolase [Nocardioidaceae bacterium]